MPPITQKVPSTFELWSIKIKLLSTAGRVWGGAEGLGFTEAEVSTKKIRGEIRVGLQKNSNMNYNLDF